MASTTFSLNITAADGETPTDSHDVSTAIKLRNYFHARAGGNHQGSDTVKVRTGAVAATGTVTCAAVAGADTVTLNGTTLTATQHHARGTVTCTASGIDVDDTVTVNGTVLTAKQHYAKGTATFSAADAGDNITIGATTFVGTTGAVTPGAATYSVDTGNTEAATSLAAQVNAHAVASTVVTASSASAVVTLRAVASGTAGNSIVLTSTDGTDLAVSGSGTLSGATAVGADQFDMSGTDAQTATSLAAAVNANATLAAIVTAQAATNVCTIRAIAAGTGGNAYTLASSDAQLAVSGANLSGGAAVGNNEFDFGGSNTQTGTALAACINASTTALVNKHATASAASGVVTVTASYPGHAGNAVTLASSNGTRLAVSAARLTGGTDTLTTHTY